MIDLSSLPKFIEGSDGGMWMLPDWTLERRTSSIYVRLADVEKLLGEPCIRHEEMVMQDGVEFVSVGFGGPNLMDAAARRGWTLYAYSAAGLTSGCLGNSDMVKYYIKQEQLCQKNQG